LSFQIMQLSLIRGIECLNRRESAGSPTGRPLLGDGRSRKSQGEQQDHGRPTRVHHVVCSLIAKVGIVRKTRGCSFDIIAAPTMTQ
jgi:hypothetical protein